MTVRILTLPDLQQKLKLGRTAILEAVKAGGLPAPIQLSPRRVGWIESEIDEAIKAKPRALGFLGRAA